MQTPPSQYRDSSGQPRLSSEDVWRLKALTMSVEASDARMRLAEERLEHALALNPAIKPLKAELESARVAQAIARRDFTSMVKEIMSATGVDIRSCAVDEATGEMTSVVEMHAEIPETDDDTMGS